MPDILFFVLFFWWLASYILLTSGWYQGLGPRWSLGCHISAFLTNAVVAGLVLKPTIEDLRYLGMRPETDEHAILFLFFA